jgi:hypothetical protein
MLLYDEIELKSWGERRKFVLLLETYLEKLSRNQNELFEIEKRID